MCTYLCVLTTCKCASEHMRACVRACVSMCVSACVSEHMRECVRACVLETSPVQAHMLWVSSGHTVEQEAAQAGGVPGLACVCVCVCVLA